MDKIGRNDPCPCGSGRKHKKCCALNAATGYDQAGRRRALSWMKSFAAETLGRQDDIAFYDFWGHWLDESDELPEEIEEIAEAAFDMWMFFDRPLEDGQLVVDRVLDDPDGLDRSARAYLTALRATAMHLWEVVDLVPGASLTLHDVLERSTVTVRERSASRTLSRHDWIAARVVACGASGMPEIERGMLHIPPLFHDRVRAQLIMRRGELLLQGGPSRLTAFYKSLPPFFHDVWIGSILEPTIPELHNTDGERILITRVTYEVLDANQLERALDAATQLEREASDGTTYVWMGENCEGERVSLGLFELKGERLLTIEVGSEEKAERARALLESLAGPAARHRSTTHEDLTRRVRDAVRARSLAGGPPDEDEPDEPEVPREVAESLVLNYMARHYRDWVDRPVPALGDKTPRQAVGDPTLRASLLELLHGLEGHYERALKAGQPAYDPSWMWSELGLDDPRAPSGAPPLAYQRVEALVPGAAELCCSVAQAERERSGSSESGAVLSDAQCRDNLALRRFLREREPHGTQPHATKADTLLARHLWAMVNFELHRRKVFWVDERLAFMLAHTDLDVLGRELRLPFPAFTVVFTDRHVLSLAERLLSRERDNPVAGHLLRALTVYVMEETRDARTMQLAFACDAMGADLPAIVFHELKLWDDARVQDQVEAASPSVIVEPAVADLGPLRGLLTVVLNAILYATSSGVEVEPRSPAPKPSSRTKDDASPIARSDEVYFLPGTIDIKQLRNYQALERLPDGRDILRRFMVRGHFRRAQKGWSDQRARWIAPHWKGPDMAAIIERAYRLKP